MPNQTHREIQFPGANPFSSQTQKNLHDALKKQGADYIPRTHHHLPDGYPKYINSLIFETSPYLLQHAHNPVNWRAWTPQAFTEAKRLNRPILLSVGYSTCHWCHVMEEESFEDEEIAGYINANFIPIKVDREERPDVDSVYMTAVQMMTGRGGWPMTVVMTPEKVPYFGGTYFPARDGDRGARVGFFTLLKRLHHAFHNDQESILSAGEKLINALQRSDASSPSRTLPAAQALFKAEEVLFGRYDKSLGGFGRAPKFPRPSVYEFLLRHYRRTQNPRTLEMVTHSARQMMFGGMYDQIAGGFHRYSTDAHWMVPHFEKMLYDNAQLAILYTELYQLTKDRGFERTAKEILDYVLKEMTTPEGAFYSATDADSEGEEGKFFVWSENELKTLLGEDAKLFLSFWGVTPGGNFEGHNILHRKTGEEDFAKRSGLSTEEFLSKLAGAKQTLFTERAKRIPPLRDDKILTEWNSQMISAMAQAGATFEEPRYTKAAISAMKFLFAHLVKDGRLLRAHRNGKSQHSGVLEDYAFFVAALLDLFEATQNRRWLVEASRFLQTTEEFFLDAKTGKYFATPADGEVLLLREAPIYDGAQPSGNSVMAKNHLRFSTLSSNDHHRQAADRLFSAFGESLQRGAVECPKLASALDHRLDRALQIVIVEPETGGTAAQFQKEVYKTFLPNRVFLSATAKELNEISDLAPVVKNKVAQNNKTTAYVCFEQVCKKPTSDLKEFKKTLSEVHLLR